MPDKEPEHPKAHLTLPAAAAKAKKRKALPPVLYEIGAAVAIGWTVYIGTNDWKQGVGAALVSMFGGGVRRAGTWYAER